MSWFPWPECIKKRVCRYLLQHYFGQFLEEKLSLDQLSVEVFSGRGYAQNVSLDSFAINELLQKVHAPFEILKGSVGSIAVYVPWSALISDSCTVEVKGLELIAQPKYRDDADLADMTDSFYKSLKNMTTSMQLAQECIHSEKKESEDQLFEGMELFAQTIESVLSRVKLTFTDITVCLEHMDSASTGIGLELKIDSLQYFDEDSEKVLVSKGEEQNESLAEPISFACKQFKINGVSISVNECLGFEAYPNCHSNMNNIDTPAKPVAIVECFGEQQVKLRIKQNELVTGPKVDAEFYLGFCCVLLTPKQITLLLDLINAFNSPATNVDSPVADSFPSSVSPTVPHEPLTSNVYKPKGRTSAYGGTIQDTIYFDTKNTNSQFYSIPKSSSVDESMPYETVFSRNHSETKQKRKMSGDNSRSPQPFVTFNNPTSERKHPLSSANNSNDAEELFRFQMKVVALSATILHVDPQYIHHMEKQNKTTTTTMEKPGKSDEVKNSDKKHFLSYTDLVKNYFLKIKKIVEKYSLTDLFFKRSAFSNVTRNHDHLRILAGPLHIECQRQSNMRTLVSSTLIDASIGNLELIECLFEGETASNSQCHCVELLVFPTFSDNMTQSMYVSSFKEQSIKVKVKFDNENEVMHTSSIQIHFADCKSEVDISIVDRINALVNALDLHSQDGSSSGTFCEYSSSKTRFINDQTLYEQILADQSSDEKCRKLDFNVTSSKVHIEFRFPIPDLRPEIYRRLWFKRSLRDEVLHLAVKDLDCNTSIVMENDQHIHSNDQTKITVRFREMTASFNDETDKPPKMFLRTCQYDSEQLDSKDDLDMPFVQINLLENKNSNHMLLDDTNSNATGLRIDDTQDHFSYEPHHNGDFPMFASHYQASTPKVPSPFSQKKVIYNNEQMILPGDEEEIQEFMDHASSTSGIDIALNFPVVQVNVPSKEFVASIYNRINNDLLLWEPAAPHPSGPSNDEVNSTFIPSKLDLASQFFSAQDWSSKSVNKSGMHVSFATLDGDTSYTSKPDASFNNQTENTSNPSMLSISLIVSKGSLSLCSGVRLGTDEEKTGQIFLDIENGNLFTVSKYHGNPNLDYACIQISSCSVHHKVGLVSIPIFDGSGCVSSVPSYLNPIIYPNDSVVSSTLSNRSGFSGTEFDSRKNITVVLKIELEEKRSMKQCVVAAVLQGLTMRHQFLPLNHSWLEQLLDVFDIEDTPVQGYEPPSFLTEVHLHLNDCAVDYKPLYLNPPLHVLATLNSVSLSSNVVANSPLSVFQIVMDSVSLYISDNDCHKMPANLPQNLVNVLDISLLEVCLKLSNSVCPDNLATAKVKFPKIDLLISNNQVLLKTCADSCAALASLIRYIAEDGDIVLSDEYADSSTMENSCAKSGSDDFSEKQPEEIENETHKMNSQHKSSMQNESKDNCEDEIASLMADAMKDIDIDIDNIKRNSSLNSLSNYSIDGNHYSTSHESTNLHYSAHLQSSTDFMSDDDDEFCIITDPIFESFHDDDPKVEYLIKNPSKIVVIENHFAPVFGKTDQLKAPQHFPSPVLRYAVKDLSLSWFMYGGNDFSSTTAEKRTTKNIAVQDSQVKYYADKSKQSPLFSDKKMGGLNRNYSVLMEFHLTKVRFQHEVYEPEEDFVSRTVCCVTDFVIRDRLQSSQINKFLYHFHNETSPKQSHANMLLVKALLIKPAPNKAPECRLKVSLQPLRLNIDQDSLTFLTDFFATLSSLTSVVDDVKGMSDTRSTAYGSTLSTIPDPLLEFEPTTETPLLQRSTSTTKGEMQPTPIQPLFFREFIFSHDVPIRLDYQGKHIDIEQGKIAGLLMGLGQLNCSQLKLRKIAHRHGLLGIDRVLNFALNVWATDIRTNQLPSILGGVGPLHSVVQFFQGFRDLVWLPVEQYRRDGRIIRGLQRGTSSFGTSTSMALLEITNRFVSLVQTAAETACDVVSPADFQKLQQKQLNSWRGLEKHALQKRQPTDFREGINNAVMLVRDGVSDTASSLARVAQKEHERKGLTGAVGGVLRHIPLTLVRPVVFASEATCNVLSGMRNQILPDAKREEENKWRASTNTA